MSVKMMMAIFAIFILGQVLSCLCMGIWPGDKQIDIWNTLASFNTMSVQSGGVWNAPKTLGTYWDGVITMLTWNYPFLDYEVYEWVLLAKIPLWVISIGVVWGIIQLFVSIIQGLVSMVRSLLPGG
jgi:hypothetical protein